MTRFMVFSLVLPAETGSTNRAREGVLTEKVFPGQPPSCPLKGNLFIHCSDSAFMASLPSPGGGKADVLRGLSRQLNPDVSERVMGTIAVGNASPPETRSEEDSPAGPALRRSEELAGPPEENPPWRTSRRELDRSEDVTRARPPTHDPELPSWKRRPISMLISRGPRVFIAETGRRNDVSVLQGHDPPSNEGG